MIAPIRTFARVVACAVAFTVSACSGEAGRRGGESGAGDTVLATPTFGPIEVPIGVALTDYRSGVRGRWCSDFEDSDLTVGDTVTLVWPDSSNDAPAVATTVAVATRSGRCAQLRGDTTDLDTPASGTVYDLALADTADSAAVAELAGGPAMAVRGTVRWTRGPDGFPRADLDGDENVEQARVCTSNEGIHLTLWTLVDTTGTNQRREHRRWRMYQMLGYDVEPSCTARETDDPPSGEGTD